ncbi:MAG: NUDIX domain-containing protein [Nanoarchaeota archaeon]
MKNTTLCILIKQGMIPLGMKKEKLGKGKYNGYGGHVEQGESIEQAALRELKEETGLTATKLEKVAEIEYFFDTKKEQNQKVHVYLVRSWRGNLKESDEMSHRWFSQDKLPFDKMWDNDKYWLPIILRGKKLKGIVHHSEDKTLKHDFKYVHSF